MSEKPRLVWIDASANFRYFANSRENIAYYLDKAVEAGFQEIIVDVRPTSGDVLFRSNRVEQVKELQGTVRTETWDYLGTFLEEGHQRGLKVHAALNTFVGGSTAHGGVVYRDAEMAALLTEMYYPTGTLSILHDTRSSAKFFNPVDERVQRYVGEMIKEVAIHYPALDGIVLDRARFNSIESDFSGTSRKAFESYVGHTLSRFPEDIFAYNAQGQIVAGSYYKKWLEFRAKVIHDFFDEIRRELKTIRPELSFGTYTGSWYSTYYNEGVNWASKRYDASLYYNWATPAYKNYGYADLLDLYMTGAYGTTIYGSDNEWTVQGAILNAKKVVKGDVPVCGSLYGLNFHNAPQDCEEAVYVVLTTGDGLMFFDIIYLIMYDQWNDVKAGIARALATEKK
ncbi:MAG: family 10 glycosylhydrolase [Bacteroides sp.]|nr:family 10 glycosylhydrolase [Bacteroides sp.]